MKEGRRKEGKKGKERKKGRKKGKKERKGKKKNPMIKMEAN